MQKFLTKRNILVLLAVLFFLIAWNRTINLLYGMFALLTGVLILAHALPRISLRGVTASRSLPASAFEGDVIDIMVDVRNEGFTARAMIEVVDSFPAAEPGSQSPMTFIAKLPRKSLRRYSFSMNCYKRGEYLLGPLVVTSSYPLGISSSRKPMPGSRAPFLVYPGIFAIVRLPIVSGSAAPMCGIEAASKAGGSEEFFGTREYQRGDSLRYIHWPSTARHSHLIVKEFEIRASVEVTIVIDLQHNSEIGHGKETTLEYAVRIAASAAKYCLDRGHTVQLACFGRTEQIVPAGGGHSQLALILETLAKVRADGEVPYPSAVNRASEFMRDGGCCLLVFSDSWLGGPDLAYTFDLLRARRIRPLCVMLDNDSFGAVAKPMPRSNYRVQVADGIEAYHISKGDPLPEVFSA